MSIFDKMRQVTGEMMEGADNSQGNKKESFTFTALPENLSQVPGRKDLSSDFLFCGCCTGKQLYTGRTLPAHH